MLLLRLEECRSAIGNRLLQFRFVLGQALDVGSGCLVVAARLLERGGSVVQLLCEAVAIGDGLRALTIEVRLPFGEVGGRGGHRRIVLLLRIAQCGLTIGDGALQLRFARSGLSDCCRRFVQFTLEAAPVGVNVGKLRCEVGFALGQALDVGSGCPVVAARLLERGGSVVQLLCETVAIGDGLGALTIEVGLPFGEVGGRGGQRRIVPLLRIAQCRPAIGNSLLESGAVCELLLNPLVQFRFPRRAISQCLRRFAQVTLERAPVGVNVGKL